MPAKVITPSEAKKLIDSGDCGLFLDVRTAGEHRAVHAVGTKNVPLDTLDASACKQLCGDGAAKIYIICKSGQRARMAAEKFNAAGIENVVVVDGGTDAWDAAGLPVNRGKGVIDLERQVRIAAGTLVASGVLLSLFVHPYFVYLSLFVGCGLVFAGVTNTCAMGMLISKMPWNRG